MNILVKLTWYLNSIFYLNSISQTTQNNNANGEILISSSTSNNSKQVQSIQPRRSIRNKDIF